MTDPNPAPAIPGAAPNPARNPDRGWILGQYVVAGGLLALSLVGIVGFLLDHAELTFSFGGAIQAFAVFPGTVVSLVVNALVMGLHGPAGLSITEKVLLGIQGLLVAVLVALHFVNDALGIVILLWGPHIVLAIVVCIVAAVRNANLGALRRSAPTAPPVPSP